MKKKKKPRNRRKKKTEPTEETWVAAAGPVATATKEGAGLEETRGCAQRRRPPAASRSCRCPKVAGVAHVDQD